MSTLEARFLATGNAWNHVTPPAARDLGHAVAEFLLAVAA